MDNEILRVSSDERSRDEEINVSIFCEPTVKTIIKKKENSFHNLLADELIEKQPLNVEKSVSVEKPKLFDTIALTILCLTISAAVAIACYFTGELFFVPAVIMIFGLAIPVSSSFFFFRLNTRGDVSFMSICKLFISGIITSVVVSLIFDVLSRSYFGGSIMFSVVKCVIELFAVGIMSIIVVNSKKECGFASVLLIACSIAAGYACAKTVTQCFYSMFIRIEIIEGNASQSIGAIINDSKYMKTSVRSLISNVFNCGIFRPFIFICLNVINGFAFKFITYKSKKGSYNSIMSGFIYPFTVILYSLSEFISTIAFLQLMYNALALFVTLFALYRVIDYCIKHENYKQN